MAKKPLPAPGDPRNILISMHSNGIRKVQDFNLRTKAAAPLLMFLRCFFAYKQNESWYRATSFGDWQDP
jgi:hypothetical protein